MRHSRRKVVKGMFAATVAGSVGEAMGQTTQPSTQPATAPQAAAAHPATTQAGASDITSQDIAALEKIEGFHYTDADRKLMADSLASNRKRVASIRNGTIDPNVDSALIFHPRPPGMPFPT